MANRVNSVTSVASYIVAGIVIFFIVSSLFEPQGETLPKVSTSNNPVTLPVFSGTHSIEFADDFDLAAALKEDLGIAIYIAIDRSNSMAEYPESGGTEAKSVIAQRVMKDIGDYLQSLGSKHKDLPIYVGVIGFNNKLYTIFPVQRLNKKSMGELQNAIANPQNFEPSGKTAIGDAIEYGCTELMKTGQILRNIIIVTDGENTSSTEPEEVIRAINENDNSLNQKEIVLRTFGTMVSIIGFDIESEYFEPMRLEGARLVTAKDETSLFKALSEVLDADISKFEWGAVDQ